MVKWVKDLALSLWWLRSLLTHGFDPWFPVCWVKELALLQLWHNRSQLWLRFIPRELPYAAGVAIEKKKERLLFFFF